MGVANPARPLVLGSSPPSTSFLSSTPSTTAILSYHNGNGTVPSNTNPIDPGYHQEVVNLNPGLAEVSYPITSINVDEVDLDSQSQLPVPSQSQRHRLELLERQKQHHLRQFLHYRQLAEQEEKENQNQQSPLLHSQGQQQQPSYPFNPAQGLGKTSAWIASLAQAEQKQQEQTAASAYVFHPADSPRSHGVGSNSDEFVEETIADLIVYESDSPSNVVYASKEDVAINESIAELLHSGHSNSNSNSTSRSSVSSSNGTVIHTPSPPASNNVYEAGTFLNNDNDHNNKAVEWARGTGAFGLDLDYAFERSYEPGLLAHQISYQPPVSGLGDNVNVNVFRTTGGKRDWTDITSYASMYEDQNQRQPQQQQQQQQQQQETGMLAQKRQMMGVGQDTPIQIQGQGQGQQQFGPRSISMGGGGLQVQPDVRALNGGYEPSYRSNVMDGNQQMMVGENGIVAASHFAQSFPAPRYGMYAGNGNGQFGGNNNNNDSSPAGMGLYANAGANGPGLNPGQMQQQVRPIPVYYEGPGYESFQPTFNGRVLPAYASMGAVVQGSSPTMPHHPQQQQQQQQHHQHQQQQQSQQRQEQGRASIGHHSPEMRMGSSPLGDYHRNMATQNADNINHLLMSSLNGSPDEIVKQEQISPRLQKSNTDEVDQIVDDDEDDDDARSIGSLVDELDADVEAALGVASSSRRPLQSRGPSTVAAKSKSYRKTPYDQGERNKRRNKSISATASASSGDLSHGSDLVSSERSVISRNILYEDGKPKVRNPLGGGRGYVPGETPDDHGKKHKCEVCGRGFARLFNLKSHAATHDPVRTKPYPCPHASCPRSFSRLHDLERHRQGIHSDGPLMDAKVQGIAPSLARAQERIHAREMAAQARAGQGIAPVPPPKKDGPDQTD